MEVRPNDLLPKLYLWKLIFPETPCGTLPILEVDGKVTITDSLAIARYVATETGKFPNSCETIFYVLTGGYRKHCALLL